MDSPAATAWFLAATMAWSLFALQDAVLTGLRRTVWVPIENTIFAATKVLLLIALAGSLTGAGIYVSWTVPAALSIVPINIMIFRWFLPSHVSRHRDTEPEGSVGLIGRYLVSDFGGSLLVSASTALLPLIVLATAGAKASAYYYIAWTVAYSMQMFSLSMGVSLSVEGAARRSEVGPGMRRMLRLLVGLQMPLVVLVAILAPLILQVFGGKYSDEGAMLLRLLALGVLPHGVNAVCLGVARVRRQLRVIFAIQAAQAGLVRRSGCRPSASDGNRRRRGRFPPKPIDGGARRLHQSDRSASPCRSASIADRGRDRSAAPGRRGQCRLRGPPG